MFDYSARERLGVGRADRFTLHSRVGNNERLLLYHRNNDSRLKRRTSAHLSPYADLMLSLPRWCLRMCSNLAHLQEMMKDLSFILARACLFGRARLLFLQSSIQW
jgi:hypothetical protein